MRRFGKYLLLDKISTGGMADVYRAKLVGIRGFTKTLAIKRIHPHLLERTRFLRMFTDEAKIASRLVHPNIVQIYDLGEEEGIPYIAMEYVPGRDLFRVVQKLVSQRQRCPWRLATRVISETCAGLYYAHEFRSLDGQPQEIVHRDVSPRNILISYSGEVKLTDFGIARARDREEHTELGVIKGKVRYISPEGAAGGKVDGRSDLYSLGVVFTEMMTMAPFREAPNDMAMLLDIRQGKFDRSRIARLPGPLGRVIERTLAVDPADRYPDANALREDLLRSVDDDSRPLSDAELKRFMANLYAEEIAAEQETERRAEQLWRDPDLQAVPRGREAADGRPAAGEGGNPLALNLPGVPRVRVPAPSPLNVRKPDLEGDLLHMPVPRLLQRLRNARETGQLDLIRDPVRKTVFFESGEPSFAVSNIEREFFGEYLVARGALTREQHAAVLDRAAREGLRFMEAALALQVVSPNQIYRFLADQIRERILEVFAWTGGSYGFYRGLLPPEPGMPLNLRTFTLIHEGVQDRVPLVVIRRELERFLRHNMVLDGNDLPSDLQLSGRQQRLIRAIESEQSTAAELIKREKDEEQILRLLYMLHQIERIEFVEADA
ncbi:MAG TPA: protein kinase [Thermoanaerobaculales bacterium]|nr:protein kinase [Thermoanaerobaculales bacterium]HQL30356.1 protein kinase [Thermoanaerobaculales bacterium]HQN95226.1 protein kinase [Thermoanaerobaculales bacterium]